MKKISEWYSELPEPEKYLALGYGKTQGILESETKSLYRALNALDWNLTNEGYNYWWDLAFNKLHCKQ